MNRIKFSHNWNNKLNNEYFTTIRSTGYDDKKFDYYSEKVGEVFSVILKGKEICKAELIFVEARDIDDICEALLIIDTGTQNYMDVFRRFGIEGYEDVIILTFRRIKEVQGDKEAVRDA